MKNYLLSLALLSKPIEGESLYLYLAVTEEVMSSVLVRIQGNDHLPIYYLSKSLAGAEIRYLRIEKLAYALVHTTRRLKPYFNSHKVVVLTKEPMKQVLGKLEQSGHLSKWAIELSEHDISFQALSAKKAQVLVDYSAKELWENERQDKEPDCMTMMNTQVKETNKIAEVKPSN